MSKSDFNPNNFEVHRLLGSGGTAKVYLGSRYNSTKLLALKAPYAEMLELPQFAALSKREYDLIGGSRYPGLVQIYEYNQEDEQTPFLVLEYCPRASLDSFKLIEVNDNLLNILSSISINLFYFQLAGLSHGDLKPHNIFLTGELKQYHGNCNLYSKISDFSLAKKSNENNERRHGLGTIGYIAPETLQDKILDHRSDIFALGIIAYKLSTGLHPFMEDETDPVRISGAIKESQPSPPSTLNHSLPPGLSDLIMTMLEKDQEKRPKNGYFICEEFEKIGAGYNYKKRIRPKHLVDTYQSRDINEIINGDGFNLNENIIDRLLDYTNNSRTLLRNILEINFTKNLLKWDQGILCFDGTADDIIYPGRLQRQNTASFFSNSFSWKKKNILTAIVGDKNDAETIGLISKEQKIKIKQSDLYYLKNNLSTATIRRFSNKLAEITLKKYGYEVLSAKLYIKAENIEKGYTVTLDAANKLINENNHIEALQLLEDFDRLCVTTNELEKRRLILMTKGDTEKMIGEAAAAEKTYMKIIELYEGCQADKLLAETYKDLGDLYKMKQNYDEGITVLKKAETLYSKLNDQLEMSHTLNNMGNIYSIIGNYDNAMMEYRKALKIQKTLKISADVASTLNNIGALYFFKGNYNRTFKVMNLALKIQREIGNAGEMARTLNNLSYLNYEMGRFDKALNYLEESTTLNRKIGSKKEILFNLENMTTFMLSAGRLKESLNYLKEGMSLSEELEDKPHTAAFYYNMATVQKRMGYYGRALENYRLALNILVEISDNFLTANCKSEQADLYIKLNDYDKANEIISEISNLMEKIDDKKINVSIDLLLGEIKNDIIPVERAIKTADQINAVRNKNVAKLQLLKMLIENGDLNRSQKIMDELSQIFVENNSDIENAGFLIQKGAYWLAKNKINSGREYIEKGYRLAVHSSLLPEVTETAASLGRIKTDSGDYETGYKYYRKALESYKIMVNDIKDKSLQKSFLSDGKVSQMAASVKKLGDLMTKK